MKEGSICLNALDYMRKRVIRVRRFLRVVNRDVSIDTVHVYPLILINSMYVHVHVHHNYYSNNSMYMYIHVHVHVHVHVHTFPL